MHPSQVIKRLGTGKPDCPAVAVMVERGEIDISFSNPFAYIRMHTQFAEGFGTAIDGKIIGRK